MPPPATHEYEEAIAQAIAWATANPDESETTAARIFHVNPQTLKSRIRRKKQRDDRPHIIHGGQNRILSRPQHEAIITYADDMHRTGLGATKQMVFAIIEYLKDLEGRPRPSWRWFQNYIKTTPGFLHTLKTKPIARNRVGAQDVKDVQDWFKNWMTWCEAHDIQPGDIINFDEAGFQIGVASGEDILVPTWIVDPLYTPSPENRRSITVIESIIANGTTIPPVLIVQGVNHMTNWYTLLDGIQGY